MVFNVLLEEGRDILSPINLSLVCLRNRFPVATRDSKQLALPSSLEATKVSKCHDFHADKEVRVLV